MFPSSVLIRSSYAEEQHIDSVAQQTPTTEQHSRYQKILVKHAHTWCLPDTVRKRSKRQPVSTQYAWVTLGCPTRLSLALFVCLQAAKILSFSELKMKISCCKISNIFMWWQLFMRYPFVLKYKVRATQDRSGSVLPWTKVSVQLGWALTSARWRSERVVNIQKQQGHRICLVQRWDRNVVGREAGGNEALPQY